jgi:choline dehydrogenase-like flavoprotein
MADGHWGQALREYARDYNHWYTLGALSELLPLADNRVTIATGVNDQNGIPVARMDYSQCENDRKNIAFAKRTLREILEAAGAQDILTIDRYAHLVGGCRMGADPERSVVGPDHRVWGIPNLLVADGSVMPTQGSANPAITIMALASRLAGMLERKRLDPQASGKPLSARGREVATDAQRPQGVRGQTDVVAPPRDVKSVVRRHHTSAGRRSHAAGQPSDDQVG